MGETLTESGVLVAKNIRDKQVSSKAASESAIRAAERLRGKWPKNRFGPSFDGLAPVCYVGSRQLFIDESGQMFATGRRHYPQEVGWAEFTPEQFDDIKQMLDDI